MRRNRRTEECRQNKNVNRSFFSLVLHFSVAIIPSPGTESQHTIKMINRTIMNNETSLNLLTFFTQSTTTSRKKKSRRRRSTQSHFQARLSHRSHTLSIFHNFSSPLFHDFPLVLVASATVLPPHTQLSFELIYHSLLLQAFYYYHYEFTKRASIFLCLRSNDTERC